MKSRVLAVGLGAMSLLGATACGGSGGTGASTASTTVRLNETSYVTAPPMMTSTTVAAVVDPATPGAVAGEQIYTVVGGDYPLGIARKHCIDLATLTTYNAWPEGDAHPYYPGDAVKIPPNACAPGSQTAATTVPAGGAATGTEATTAATEAQATSTTADPASGGTYTVVAGDYLGGIAAKNGTTAEAIATANGWSDGVNHLIIPGQKIQLPAKAG